MISNKYVWNVKMFLPVLIVLFSLVNSATLEDPPKTYPPGYIGALNSTIVNLMNQLKTYQQYIEQAFQPLNTYDQVFKRPASEFPKNPSAEKDGIVSTRLNEKTDSDKGTPIKDAKTKSPQLTNDETEPEELGPDLELETPVSPSNQGSFPLRTRKRNRNYDTRKRPDNKRDDDQVLDIDSRKDLVSKGGGGVRYDQSDLSDKCGVFDPSSGNSNDAGGHILWPWSVKLGKGVRQGFLYKCGGSLITLQHVVTSAHCVSRDGEIDTLSHLGIKMKFEQIKIHPDFKEGVGYNDIAVIKLIEPFNTSTLSTVMPACSIPSSTTLKNSLEKINGFSWTTEWKYSNKDRKLSMVIRNLYTTIRDNESCEKKYREATDTSTFDVEFPNGFDSSLICAKSARKDICQRSSGNSLLTRDRASQTSFIIGIVVKGEDACGEDGSELPAIFTRISNFSDWVMQFVAEGKKQNGDEDGLDYLYDF